MEIIQTILWAVAGVVAVIIIGIFLVIAFALSAYYHTEEGQASLLSAKDKKKKKL